MKGCDSATDLAQGHFLAELCAEKAGENFKSAAYQAFVDLASRRPYFTTAQVRKDYIGPPPHDGRAWGHIVLQALREGVISPTEKILRTGSHGRNDAVWRSLIIGVGRQ